VGPAAILGWALLAPLGVLDAAEPARFSSKEIEAAVKSVRGRIAAREFEEAARAARDFAKKAPDEPRFLYLEAEVMVAFDQDPKAKELRDRALSLNPDREVPHYTAGAMLETLGRRTLAVHEWEAVLAIPPDGEVYDANACMRLGAIYAGSGLFARAADAYARGVELVAEGRAAGAGVGMIGGTQESLRKRIRELRQKAKRFPPGRDTVVRDALGDTDCRLGMTLIVKDDKLTEFRRALGSVQASFTMNVQPRGLRLFDVAPVKLKYDPAKKHLLALLGKNPCCDPIPFTPERETARVAIHSLDCCYIFEVDSRTGEAKKQARFEGDYRLQVRAGIKLAAAAVTATINGERYDWGALLDGHRFDYLPEALDVALDGKRRSGEPVHVRFKVRVQEPKIQPLYEEKDE
jgi:tetratricopeptide (TPR) repeat protein